MMVGFFFFIFIGLIRRFPYFNVCNRHCMLFFRRDMDLDFVVAVFRKRRRAIGVLVITWLSSVVPSAPQAQFGSKSKETRSSQEWTASMP